MHFATRFVQRIATHFCSLFPPSGGSHYTCGTRPWVTNRGVSGGRLRVAVSIKYNSSSWCFVFVCVFDFATRDWLKTATRFVPRFATRPSFFYVVVSHGGGGNIGWFLGSNLAPDVGGTFMTIVFDCRSRVCCS